MIQIEDPSQASEMVQLRITKFQNVKSLQIFIEDNFGSDITRINRIELFGTLGENTDMSSAKAAAAASTVEEELNVLLCLTGSVATIKWLNLIAELTEQGKVKGIDVNVKVVASERAEHFVYLDGQLAALKDVEVYTDAQEWDAWRARGDPVTHIDLRRWANVVLIAPLSANTLSKIANGAADNLLTSVMRCLDLSSEGRRKCPVYLCPAMNTMMWDNTFTREHLEVVKGAMAEPKDIAAAVLGGFEGDRLPRNWEKTPGCKLGPLGISLAVNVALLGILVTSLLMGRKNKHSEGGSSKVFRPFCYYCERDFDDEKVLIQHQKIKHFKCSTCQRKLDTASGLVAHMLQVHRETLNKVPDAIKGRENPDLQVRGMENVPMGLILERAKGTDMENFYLKKHQELKHEALPPPRPTGGMPFMPFMPPPHLLVGNQPIPGQGLPPNTTPPPGMPGLGVPPLPPMPPFFMPPTGGGPASSSPPGQTNISAQPPAGLPVPPPFPGFPPQGIPGFPMPFPPMPTPPQEDQSNASNAVAAAMAAATTAAGNLQGATERSRSRSRSPRRNYTAPNAAAAADGSGRHSVHGTGQMTGVTLTPYREDLQKGDQVCFEEMRAAAMLAARG
ncbi:hypothetical protein FOL47_007064 [Perkinsus chesapeaki]|uniref:Uncharacterized protein n=1 Tax=Perkinsus chesapeaki TaxID=330153 RepID=A0A7J6LMW6_PERCH|nr:hypothetical protein FOL47_007064 [Perkinsus chesapeaki]